MKKRMIVDWVRRLWTGGSPVADTATGASAERGMSIEGEAASASYSSDRPIESEAEDRFNRWPFAERVAQTIAKRPDPGSLVVGIYGPWGDGKTSTLRLMEKVLESAESAVVIRFNPWHFPAEEQLLRSFFTTLADALGRSLPTGAEEVGKLLKRYGGILSVASLSFGGVVQVNPGAGVQSLGGAFSTVELDELRGRLERILRESGKRLVIFIDDIDRLDRREIQAIFKLVKLSAAFDYTSYVLAFDDEMVAAAIGENYAGGGSEAGRSFLGKIIQVPLHLPRADEIELRKFTFEGVESALKVSGIELTAEQGEAFGRHFVDGLEPRVSTPRHARLYGNALMFALPILKGEVHPVDQMLIEGIRILYPKLYGIIRDQREVFLRGKHERTHDDTAQKRIKDLIEGALDGPGVDKVQVRQRLLEVLFPRLKSVFGGGSYGADFDSQWFREQRAASPGYFDRYFSYAVPPGDVSDIRVAELVDKAMEGGREGAEAMLRELGSGGGIRRVVSKLRHQEERIEEPAASGLAVAIAHQGGILPRERQMLGSDWTFRQAGILVARLVRHLSEGEGRARLAEQIINEAEPLGFACECLRWLRKGDDKPETERLVPAEIEERLGRVLAQRVAQAAREGLLDSVYPDDLQGLFWVWGEYGQAGEVEQYLVERFDADPSSVEKFLGIFVGRAWGLESGLSHLADFGREAYNALAKLISPEKILERLSGSHPDLSKAEYFQPRETPAVLAAARQFAFIHRKVMEEQVGKAEARASVPPEGDLA